MEYTIEELAQLHSDLYKDAYGFRPRLTLKNWNQQTLLQEIDYLETVITQQIASERQAQEASVASFEKKVESSISYGAKDRQTALRWMFEAEELDFSHTFDRELFCFKNNLPFTYFGG